MNARASANKVSSFSVCTDQWDYNISGGATDLFVCKGENNPDLTKQVGTYAFTAGPVGGITGGNSLYLSTEQLEINGCILQRTGTWDSVLDGPTEYGIWTVQGKSKGCPKATNIADYEYSSVEGNTQTQFFETYTIGFKKPVMFTPLTTITHTKE